MAGTKLSFTDLEEIGPGTPAGRYLRTFWHPVVRVRDVPCGRAKPIEILGEKLTVYRSVEGVPHVVDFRCAHRGAQLSLGWVEGDKLRCRYHGWQFDSSGHCVEQPNEEEPFCKKVKIKAYRTREYVGLIFAYFGDGEAPPFRHYPDLDVPGIIVTDPVEHVPCTFWNKMDNDPGHVPWVHRATALRKGRNDILRRREGAVEETAYGAKTINFTGDVDGAMRAGSVSHFIMPNTRQFWPRTRAKGFEGRNLWDTKVVWTVPVNDEAYASFDVTHTPLEGEEAIAYAESRYDQQESEAKTRWDLAEKILAGEMTLEDLPEVMSAYTSFAIEDYVTQVGQGPIAARGKEMLAATDAKTALIRRLWLREVGALLEGRPLKQWKIPTGPRDVFAKPSQDEAI